MGFIGVSVVVVLPPRHLVESRCLKATDTHPADKTKRRTNKAKIFKHGFEDCLRHVNKFMFEL